MNNKIKLAVAGAVLSAASAANAGIVIPAGDWTLDVNGNVNAFAIFGNADTASAGHTVNSGIAQLEDASGEDSTYAINTGLLPAWLGFSGTTRQNDVDVSFTISFQPNVSDNQSSGMGDTLTPLNRQAFLTFGDKSWGTVKVGKDLGIFAGQAILHDMTLLGVGAAGHRSGGVTTLGGIGSGYVYPAWKGQISYTTPNMNGFQATLAITNPDQGQDQGAGTVNGGYNQDRFGIEGQVSYDWTGDVAGKVWASFADYDRNGGDVVAGTNAATGVTGYKRDNFKTTAYDLGINVKSGNLGVVGYYYNTEGAGHMLNLLGSTGYYASSATNIKERDGDGGYVQATYVIPTGTKLGVAYGVNKLDEASGETNAELMEKNERWTVGAYHPLTKHLNLVAEYNRVSAEAQGSNDADSDTFSLGAILFF
jgi:predicted porin